jgi:hypothetical protein
MNFLVVVPVFLAMGFSLSFLGGVTRYKTFYTLFPKIDTVNTTGAQKSHNSLIQGTSVSSLNLGAALGCLSTMYLGNKLGRRRTVMLGAIITLVGTALQCSAFSLAQLIVSRGELQMRCCPMPAILICSGAWFWTRYDVLHRARLAVRDEQGAQAGSPRHCRRYLYRGRYRHGLVAHFWLLKGRDHLFLELASAVVCFPCLSKTTR